MEEHIRLLDCTLRDGGHINQGKFGEVVIRSIIERLIEAGIDIIEVGFLWENPNDASISRYYTIEDVKRILPENIGKSKFSLMADFIDLDHLEPCDGTIEYIRLSFKRFRLDWALETAKTLMDKGYKVFINPVNCNVYSDKEYIEVLEKVNQLHPYGFAIVDTFGVMRVSDLSHRYYLVENNLLPDITIGLHLHENLGLAYSLAQQYAQIAKPTRNIVIDGSLLGMGRVPGNLCIEQVIDFLNNQYGKNYSTEPLYDAIDDYVAPIKRKSPWGYAIPYALSAKYSLHRTYAEYLMGKQRLKIKDIQRILRQVDASEAEMFNEEYVEGLYREYINVEYDDENYLSLLKEEFRKFKNVLVIAPGHSIVDYEKNISENISENTCVISVNFIPENLKINMVFLTNTKRYDCINGRKYGKLIITSNLLRDVKESDYVVSYNDNVYFHELFCDDSTMILFNLLLKAGVKNVVVAGFDGQLGGKKQFYDNSFDRNVTEKSKANLVKAIFTTTLSDISVKFITPSEYIVS